MRAPIRSCARAAAASSPPGRPRCRPCCRACGRAARPPLLRPPPCSRWHSMRVRACQILGAAADGAQSAAAPLRQRLVRSRCSHPRAPRAFPRRAGVPQRCWPPHAPARPALTAAAAAPRAAGRGRGGRGRRGGGPPAGADAGACGHAARQGHLAARDLHARLGHPAQRDPDHPQCGLGRPPAQAQGPSCVGCRAYMHGPGRAAHPEC